MFYLLTKIAVNLAAFLDSDEKEAKSGLCFNWDWDENENDDGQRIKTPINMISLFGASHANTSHAMQALFSELLARNGQPICLHSQNNFNAKTS